MSLLEQVCASGGTLSFIDSLEFTCDIWPGPLRLVQGFYDMQLGFGDGTYGTFLGAPLGLVFPERNNTSSQKVTMAIDNVLGDAQRLIDQAEEADAIVKMTLRRYVEGELYGPAQRPFIATVQGGMIKDTIVQVNAGFHNILDYAWPRGKYDLDYCPDLAYMV